MFTFSFLSDIHTHTSTHTIRVHMCCTVYRMSTSGSASAITGNSRYVLRRPLARSKSVITCCIATLNVSSVWSNCVGITIKSWEVAKRVKGRTRPFAKGYLPQKSCSTGLRKRFLVYLCTSSGNITPNSRWMHSARR